MTDIRFKTEYYNDLGAGEVGLWILKGTDPSNEGFVIEFHEHPSPFRPWQIADRASTVLLGISIGFFFLVGFSPSIAKFLLKKYPNVFQSPFDPYLSLVKVVGLFMLTTMVVRLIHYVLLKRELQRYRIAPKNWTWALAFCSGALPPHVSFANMFKASELLQQRSDNKTMSESYFQHKTGHLDQIITSAESQPDYSKVVRKGSKKLLAHILASIIANSPRVIRIAKAQPLTNHAMAVLKNRKTLRLIPSALTDTGECMQRFEKAYSAINDYDKDPVLSLTPMVVLSDLYVLPLLSFSFFDPFIGHNIWSKHVRWGILWDTNKLISSLTKHFPTLQHEPKHEECFILDELLIYFS